MLKKIRCHMALISTLRGYSLYLHKINFHKRYKQIKGFTLNGAIVKILNTEGKVSTVVALLIEYFLEELLKAFYK